MPEVKDFQASFNTGELSPRMQGRGDFNKFKSGASVVENLLALPQGGLTRRPGTRYVVEVKDSTAKCRLIDFVFSTTQAYIIEAGNAYFRFIRNQAQITAANISGSIANGTFTTDLNDWDDRDGGSGTSAHDATNGRMSLTPGGTAVTDYARREQDVAVTNGDVCSLRFTVLGGKAGDKIKLRVGTASEGTQIVNDVEFMQGYHVYTFTATAATIYIGFTAYGSDQNKLIQIDDVSLIDNAPIEIQTPYATADLFTLKWAQTADILYLVHPSYPVYKLTRSGHSSWSLTEVRFEDGPYLDVNTTATQLTPAAGTGNAVVFTSTTTLGINKNTGFSTGDVGRAIRFRNASTEWLWGVIVGSSTATSVQVDILRTSTSTGASTQWRLGSFSSTQGWPSAVCFFEQRLGLARNTALPQSFWLSQSGEIENMRPDSLSTGVVQVEADDALDFTIASDQVNAIRWMSPGTALVLGTDGGEFVVDSDGSLVTPTDVNVRRHTNVAVADVAPVRVDHAILFNNAHGRRIHEFAFRFEVDGYVAPDMTLLADHVLRTRVVELAYQQSPDSILWALREDGALATMTYRRDQDIVGWGRQNVGGTYQDGNAVVESIRTIPGNNGSGQEENSQERDEVWVISKRTLGGSTGSTARYIEVFEKTFEGPREDEYSSTATWTNAMLQAQRHAYYADSLLTYDDPLTITNITQDSTAVITSTSHGLSTNDIVIINDVVGMKEINVTASTAHSAYRVGSLPSTDTFTLTSLASTAISSTAFTPYISGGKVREKVTSISGLSHLAGETVAVLADGAIHPESTVTSTGGLTLQDAAAVVQIGLPYTHKYKSLRLAPNTQYGAGFGQTMKVGEIALLLLDTGAFNIGPSIDTLSPVDFRQVNQPMGIATPLVSTEYLLDFPGDFTEDPRIVIQSSHPMPFTMLGLVPDIQASG